MAWVSFLIQLVVENLLYQITGKPSLFIRALTGQQCSEVQQHNREQAIRLHLQGMKRQDIAHIVGIHTSTLGAWIALYNKGGAEALKLGQRGRRKGDGRTLSAPQEKRLKEMMVGQCPDQMELPFALWSSGVSMFAPENA